MWSRMATSLNRPGESPRVSLTFQKLTERLQSTNTYLWLYQPHIITYMFVINLRGPETTDGVKVGLGIDFHFYNRFNSIHKVNSKPLKKDPAVDQKLKKTTNQHLNITWCWSETEQTSCQRLFLKKQNKTVGNNSGLQETDFLWWAGFEVRSEKWPAQHYINNIFSICWSAS